MRRRYAYAPNVRPPRVWTVFIAYLVAIIAAVTLGGIALITVMLARGELDASGLPSPELLSSALGVFVMIVPSQLGFGGVALMAALSSREPFRTRLGLTRIRLSAWKVGVFLLVAMIPLGLQIVFAPFKQAATQNPSPLTGPLEMLSDMAGAGDTPLQAALVIAMFSLAPGIMEELLFRGYILGRLLKRWHPVKAIMVTALLFSAAHLHPLHALGVLPLGVLLGFITWRCGSVIPAMLLHTANNMSIALTHRVTSELEIWGSDAATGMCVIIGLAVMAAGGLALVGTIIILVRERSPAPAAAPIAFFSPRPASGFPRRRRSLSVASIRSPLEIPHPPPDAHPSRDT